MTNLLGEFVRAKRGSMSLREFAKKCCGLSHTVIDSIEKGIDPRTGNPVSANIDTLSKLAVGCGVRTSFLAALATGEEEEKIIADEITKIYGSLSESARKKLISYGDDLMHNPANKK